jgi:hypothetical protein
LRVAEQAAQMPDTRLVYIADRECDFIDLMTQANAMGTPVDWLIRSARNRKLVGEQDKLWEGFGEQHWGKSALPCRRGRGKERGKCGSKCRPGAARCTRRRVSRLK